MIFKKRKNSKELSADQQINQTDDYYFENGLMVMTEKYHLKRGYCCGNECRHCPFNHENVTN